MYIKKIVSNIKDKPRLLLPFFLIAIAQVYALAGIFLGPRPPLKGLFNPVVRRFWGELYLHYPTNFVLIPKLFDYFNLVLVATAGVLMTAAACNLFKSERNEPGYTLGRSTLAALKKYHHLFIYWILIFGFTKLIFRGVDLFLMDITPYFFYLAFGLAILLEVLVVFTIPAIIIDNVSVFKGLARSIMTVIRHPLASFLYILVPYLLYGVYVAFRRQAPLFIAGLSPETTLYFLYLGVFISFIVDTWTIVAACTIYSEK